MQIALKNNGQPPTEFRLFKKGLNDTEKGTFLFDDKAAASVMAKYKKRGVDLMIDLEHQALSDHSADPNARDARGWFQLAVKADGSLWAVGVKWTPDGQARLSEKRQRYVSPAFSVDPKTNRVIDVTNCAITALPATHETPALVAASAVKKQTAQAIEEPPIEEEEEPIDEETIDDFATWLNTLPECCRDSVIEFKNHAEKALKECQRLNRETQRLAREANTLGRELEAAVANKLNKAADALEQIAAERDALKAQLAEAEGVELVSRHPALVAERASLAAARAELEAAERHRLCADLVKSGSLTPGQAWDHSEEGSVPKSYLLAMPIASFRQFAKDSITASKFKGAAPSLRPSTPVDMMFVSTANGKVIQTKLGTATLSAREVRNCEELKVDPQVYALNKIRHEQSKGTAL